MRVSRTIVRMTALPAEAQQKIIVKLHSLNAFHQDLCAPVQFQSQIPISFLIAAISSLNSSKAGSCG